MRHALIRLKMTPISYDTIEYANWLHYDILSQKFPDLNWFYPQKVF